MQRVQTELLLASLCTAGKIAWTSERVSARSYLLCTFAANRLSLLSYVAGYKTQSRLPVAIVGQHAIVRRMSALQMRVLEPAMAAVADQISPVIGASQRFMPGEDFTFSPLPNSDVDIMSSSAVHASALKDSPYSTSPSPRRACSHCLTEWKA